MCPRSTGHFGPVLALALLSILSLPPVAAGQRTFQPTVGVAVGGNAVSIRAGDLDGDGDADIVAANGLDHTVSVLLNNGNATFSAPVTYAATFHPVAVALGDFDGDSDLDIAAANQNNDRISILLNAGNGTFLAQVQYATGGPLPMSVATGDLDGDGDLDLAVGLGNFVSIMLNHGSGTFPIPTLYTISAPVGSIGIGDLDRDGDLDVVGAKSSTSQVALLLNNGNGTFQAAVSLPIADTETSRGVALGDVDSDGDLDIVSANATSGVGIGETVTVLFNDGTATFGPPSTYQTGDEFTSARNVEVRDMDGEGSFDIVVAHAPPSSPPTVSVFFSNHGDGTFRPPLNVGMMLRADYPMPISAMTVADFNGDGLLDIAASGVTGADKRVTFALNRPSLLAWPVSYPSGTTPVALESADLDGDADHDLVVVNQGDGKIAALFNNGDGTFAAAVYDSTGPSPYALTMSDLDADGDTDAAVGRNDGSTNPLTVHWNDGTGVFSAFTLVTLNAAFQTNPISLASANLDADVDADIVAANSVYLNSLIRNDGYGVFTASNIGTAMSNWDVALGDIDGDGDHDYVADYGNSIAVRKNNGNGTFASEVFTAIGFGQFSLELKDLDGDSDLDLAMALNSIGLGAKTLNDGNGAFGTPLVFAHGGGNQSKVVSADFDGDGDNDLAFVSYSASNVTILLNDGPGTPGAPIPAAAGQNPRSLSAADFDGDGDVDLVVANQTSGDVSILFNQTVATSVRASARAFRLAPNYPNPFNPSTTIAFQLPVRSRVSAQIFDVRGRLVRTLLDAERGEGPHDLQWNGRGERGEASGSGVYFLRLLVTGPDGVTHAKVAKMVLLK